MPGCRQPSSPHRPLGWRRRRRQQLQHAGHCKCARDEQVRHRQSADGSAVMARPDRRFASSVAPGQHTTTSTTQQLASTSCAQCIPAHVRWPPHTKKRHSRPRPRSPTCAVAHHARHRAARRLQLVGRGGPNLAVAEGAGEGGVGEDVLQSGEGRKGDASAGSGGP